MILLILKVVGIVILLVIGPPLCQITAGNMLNFLDGKSEHIPAGTRKRICIRGTSAACPYGKTGLLHHLSCKKDVLRTAEKYL